jgi:hypothetical protein
MKFNYRPKKDFSKTRGLTVKISKYEYEKLKAIAIQKDTTIANLVRDGFLKKIE